MASVLTAEPATAPTSTRPGAIILARHGEPALSRRVRLTADEYRKFWADYEVLGLLPGQTPPKTLVGFVDKCGTLVASTRLRSIESAQALAAGRAFSREALLIEAPLPPPRWPRWVRMTPRMWGFWARLWWWFFDHHEGQETRREAQARSDQAAAMLVGLAAGGQDVVVLAHGFFNFMIGRSLRRLGWKLTAGEGYKYWSMRRFERP
ncbi:MAG: histidine phosphatase family protein [Phenylobacterium sp.]